MPPPARKPRADAERNRRLLLDTAKAGFAAKGSAISLEEIARDAGVGIGTLYRHFPTREALVGEVYRAEATQLVESATALAATRAPLEALRLWLRQFVDYIATKRVMAEAVQAAGGDMGELYAAAAAQIATALNTLVRAAEAAGEIGYQGDPMVLLHAVFGATNVGSGTGWQDNAHALVDILIAGLRRGPLA